MLPKVTHYMGFQSYGELPYPTLKPGKKTLDSNKIYEKTKRKEDHVSVYENYNRFTTDYRQKMLKTLHPRYYQQKCNEKKENFQKKIKFQSTALNFNQNTKEDLEKQKRTNQNTKEDLQKQNILNQNTKEDLEKQKSINLNTKEDLEKQKRITQNTKQDPQNQFLRTGVEHWQSTYTSSIVDPYKYSTATRPEWTIWSKPYQVSCRVGPSEMKFRYGTLGSKPTDIMNHLSTKQPYIEDPLKMGTTQLTSHIPGYTGFLPSAKTATMAYLHGKGLKPRTTYLKQNILENYHTTIPGYAGHLPKSSQNQRFNLREFCFSTQ